MLKDRYIAIYDFEFFPYALGDVLTWNVRTAMRCEELGKKYVDTYICIDKKFPASIYQRGLINTDNFELFFGELYEAFGTNPKLGNIFIFRKREEMLLQLQNADLQNENNIEVIADYLQILDQRVATTVINKTWAVLEEKIRANKLIKKFVGKLLSIEVKQAAYKQFSHESILNNYFIKYIHSHAAINEFAASKGYIPFLHPALGCNPDVEEIINRHFMGKKIVVFHVRQRRLDIGYGGEHTYSRDSDFLEWYDFLKKASIKYPQVQFVTLGRLSEKPLEFLKLPNVISLRSFGMTLGHELTLMLRSDLFIGTSSGFAALANFSLTPYFITKMNEGACNAYAINYGEEKLPFARENQKLVYEKETSTLLMDLLENGLMLTKDDMSNTLKKQNSAIQIDPISWLNKNRNPYHKSRTISRFYTDSEACNEETSYLLLPYLENARLAFTNRNYQETKKILELLSNNFSFLCDRLPEYLLVAACLAFAEENILVLKSCIAKLETLKIDNVFQSIINHLNQNLEKGQEFSNRQKPQRFLEAQMEQFSFCEMNK